MYSTTEPQRPKCIPFREDDCHSFNIGVKGTELDSYKCLHVKKSRTEAWTIETLIQIFELDVMLHKEHRPTDSSLGLHV